MNDIKKLVRQFGEATHHKTQEIATKIGVTLDREFLEKRFAINWAMSALIAEDAGEVVEMNEELARKAEASTPAELGVAFCLNTCRGGFVQVEAGDYTAALEAFGLVRSVHGYLLREDYRKMFARSGQEGGKKRHAKSQQVKEWAIAKYQTGRWKSALQFAKAIEAETLQKSEEFGASLSTENVRDTVAKWIRAHNKKASRA